MVHTGRSPKAHFGLYIGLECHKHAVKHNCTIFQVGEDYTRTRAGFPVLEQGSNWVSLNLLNLACAGIWEGKGCFGVGRVGGGQ